MQQQQHIQAIMKMKGIELQVTPETLSLFVVFDCVCVICLLF